jgi:hypothetical protein
MKRDSPTPGDAGRSGMGSGGALDQRFLNPVLSNPAVAAMRKATAAPREIRIRRRRCNVLPPFACRVSHIWFGLSAVGSLGGPPDRLKMVPQLSDTGAGNEGLHSADGMRLILLTVLVSLAVGLLAGGSLRDFPAVKIRWSWLVLVGVGLQFAAVRGTLAFPMLLASFAFLIAFVLANVQAPGFVLILVGLSLNVLVIGVNQGMPVSRQALVSSGQAGTLIDLTSDTDGQKHFLADDGTDLLPLGDVIGIGSPIHQAISIGDGFVHVGIGWFIVVALRKPKRIPVAEPQPAEGW